MENTYNVKELREKLKIENVSKGTPLYIVAYRKIRELIVDGTFKTGEKLIPEAELADMLKIGRTSLRTAFSLLYEDNYLKTYQGKGTYVVYDKDNSADQFPENYIMPRRRLERVNSAVQILDDQLRTNTPDEFLNEILKVDDSSTVFFQRTYSIDGTTPALVMQTYFLPELYPELDYGNPDALEAWLEHFLREKVDHVTLMVALTFSDTIGRTFKIRNNKGNKEAFSLITSVWRGREGEPFLFSKDYYNDNIVRFSAKLTV
jgi:Transcriptional regulators